MWAVLSLLTPKRRAYPARGRGVRPRLEALEDRDCPSGGVMEWSDPFGSGATAVAVQPDGKMVLVGQITRNVVQQPSASLTVQRLNPDGTMDTTFNGTGSLIIQTGKSDRAMSVALQPDGKILVGGAATANNGSGQFLVARVNANGALDTTFGSKGLWLAAGAGPVQALAVLTDATHTAVTGIVAAAQGSANGQAAFEAIKLTPAGQPDKTFGSGGFAVLTAVAGSLESMAVSPAGEIYMVGATDVTRADGKQVAVGVIEAATPAGRLDTTFGGGTGYVLADPTGTQGSHFYDAALQTLTVGGQPVTRLVVAGQSWDPSNMSLSYGMVSRYTTAGALDTTFGQSGTFITTAADPSLNASLLQSVALQADGSIVVGGYKRYATADGTTQPEALLGRLTADGAADTAFGPAGTGFIIVQDGYASQLRDVVIDPTTGEIVVAGSSTSTRGAAGQTFVARFSA